MAIRKSRLILAVALPLFLVGGAALVVPPLLSGDGADYRGVVSIERDPAYQDPALLARAWDLPVARLYGADRIDFQRNPSFCGPTSIVNVLHSLGQPGSQQDVLEGTGTRTVFGLVMGGLTLDEEAAIARTRTGRTVTALRDLPLADFRAEVARANDPARRYIANFSRGPLFARGGGHHSPIAGYLADRDLVLVVDVNRGFRPWLVPTERLWQATRTIDSSTGKQRGLLRIE